MSQGLAGAASRGALWLGLVNLLSKGSQVFVTLALGLFLTAAELGSVTVTVALVNLALVVQSAGVYDVIARTSEEPRRFAGTVVTISVGLGALIAVLAAVLAPQLAELAGARTATDLLRVAVLSLPFTALAGVQMAYLHRQLDFRRRLVPDAGSALAGAAVTVVGAAAGLGEWSLVAGLVTTAVLAPLLGTAVGIRLRPRWSAAHARTVGRWAAVTGPGAVLGLVLLNLDYVVVTRVLGEAATGVYSFAFRIAFVPYVMGAVVLGGVAFPLYARLMASGGERAMAPAVVRFVHVLAATTGGAYLALALLADRIVVIDPRWAGSAPVLRVLTVYGVLLGLVLMGHEALRASGRPGSYLRAQVVHVVVLLVAAVTLVRFGIVGMAWAQVGAVAVAAVVVVVMLARAGVLGSGLGRALLPPLGAAALVAVGHQAAGRAGLLPPADSLVGGAVVGVLVLLAYVGALVVVDRPLVRDLRAAVAR
ncbi:oligosaccharide flippase family protein [Geodermatophilus dictyosporus]|uniref:oligosaccharide flippase family protein n=1 Tax=Geodermatophilus dictyosporus TaxID=1523247 RepID=UPI00145C1C5D|nr:oligosaccharide flippase family protein [Geodermatophilus dictyosporus]